MSRWREVQEYLYQTWATEWGSTTPYVFENEGFDPPEDYWARFSTTRLPGGPGTIGAPGNKKMDRVGMVSIQIFGPPRDGVGTLSDYAEVAAALFENKRFPIHGLRFSQVEPGESGEMSEKRWYGVLVEGRFEYEDIR